MAINEGTAEVAARVAEARYLAASRDGRAALGAGAIGEGSRGQRLSAQGWTRAPRLARTIADLDRSNDLRRVYFAEALTYRRALPEVDGVAARSARFDWRGALGARA